MQCLKIQMIVIRLIIRVYTLHALLHRHINRPIAPARPRLLRAQLQLELLHGVAQAGRHAWLVHALVQAVERRGQEGRAAGRARHAHALGRDRDGALERGGVRELEPGGGVRREAVRLGHLLWAGRGAWCGGGRGDGGLGRGRGGAEGGRGEARVVVREGAVGEERGQEGGRAAGGGGGWGDGRNDGWWGCGSLVVWDGEEVVWMRTKLDCSFRRRNGVAAGLTHPAELSRSIHRLLLPG